MLKDDTKAEPDPNVVLTELRNGENVLLHIGTQTYYTLNESGSVIWHMMSKGFTLGEITQRLQTQYDVSPGRARQSVFDLIAELANAKLLSMDGNLYDPEAKNSTGI